MLTVFTSVKSQTPCTCHILTRNNAGTIRDTLDSAVGSRCFTNILVLIDVSSADPTGRIVYEYSRQCRQLHIVPYKWADPPEFDAARNYEISITRTPYAFWLDGDEVIVQPAAIRAMLQRQHGQAFLMWVVSPVSGGGFHNMLQPRLFPVKPGVRFQCPVFERIDWSLKATGTPMEMTETKPIYHPGYSDRDTLKKKNIRNMRIMRKYLREHKIRDERRAHIEAQYRKLGGK